jgi:hypothetical protein
MLGKVWLGQWEARQAIGITQQLEQDFQLTQTKGLKQKKSSELSALNDQPPDSQPPEHQPPARLTSAEIQRSTRTRQAPVRQVLQQLIQQALTQPSWSGVVSAACSAHTPISAITFCQRLQRLNVQVEPNIAPSTGRLNGFSFMYQGVAFKGSQVGYSLNTLIKHGLHYDPAQDAARLRRLTDQRQPTDQLDPDESTDRPAHRLDAIVSRTAAATANTAQRFDDRARLANQFAHDVRQLKDIIDHTNEHAANAARHAAETTKRIDQVLERLTASAENANTSIRATARQLVTTHRAYIGPSQQNGRTDVTSTQSTDASAVQSGPDCTESSPNCAKSSPNIHEAATRGIECLQRANPSLGAAIKQFRAPYEQLDRLIQQQLRLKNQANAEQKELMDMIRQHKKIINERSSATSIQRIYKNWTYYRDQRHEAHFESQQKRFTEILDDIECMAMNRRNHYQFLKDQIMVDAYSIASTRKMAFEQRARLEQQEKAFERWFSQLKQQMSPAPIRHHIYEYLKEIKRTMDQIHQSWQSITGRRYANGQPILQYSQADIDTYWQYVEKLTDCPHRIQSLSFGIARLLSESDRYQYQEQEFKMLKKIVDRGHETLNGIMTYDQRLLNNEENEWIVHYRIKMGFLEKMHQGMPMYQQELKALIKYGFYQPVQPTAHVQPSGARSSSPQPYQRPSWL